MGNSLIFTAASSQYLSATGKTGINQQKFTIAFWFKRVSTGSSMLLYYFGDILANGNYFQVLINRFNKIEIDSEVASSINTNKISSSTYTDSSWHHLLVSVDTTQATANNRVRLYVDGTEITSWQTNTNPSQNTNLANNYATPYNIGRLVNSSNYFDGNLAFCYYIDGQQLTPASFISGMPGYPITYMGSYSGVYSFFLPFSNDASTVTLGLDSSGEGNFWALNNMTTTNQSSDSPSPPTFLGSRVLYIPAGTTFVNSNIEPISIGISLVILFGTNSLIPTDKTKLELLVIKPSGQQFVVTFPFCFVGEVDIPLTLSSGFSTFPVFTTGTYVVGQIFGNQIDQFGAWIFSLLSSGYPISPQVTIIVNPS